jgi:hypothetical protein
VSSTDSEFSSGRSMRVLVPLHGLGKERRRQVRSAVACGPAGHDGSPLDLE